MAERRQRPIPVTGQERTILAEQKKRYEQSTGDRADWGKFLGTVTLVGLATAGIYALAGATPRSEQSASVECGGCGESFLMAIPNGADRAIYTICPHCDKELVVYLDMP